MDGLLHLHVRLLADHDFMVVNFLAQLKLLPQGLNFILEFQLECFF